MLPGTSLSACEVVLRRKPKQRKASQKGEEHLEPLDLAMPELLLRFIDV